MYQPFGTITDLTKDCSFNQCNTLRDNLHGKPTILGPKADLLCGYDDRWYLCDKEGVKTFSNGEEFICNNNRWIDTNSINFKTEPQPAGKPTSAELFRNGEAFVMPEITIVEERPKLQAILSAHVIHNDFESYGNHETSTNKGEIIIPVYPNDVIEFNGEDSYYNNEFNTLNSNAFTWYFFEDFSELSTELNFNPSQFEFNFFLRGYKERNPDKVIQNKQIVTASFEDRFGIQQVVLLELKRQEDYAYYIQPIEISINNPQYCPPEDPCGEEDFNPSPIPPPLATKPSSLSSEKILELSTKTCNSDSECSPWTCNQDINKCSPINYGDLACSSTSRSSQILGQINPFYNNPLFPQIAVASPVEKSECISPTRVKTPICSNDEITYQERNCPGDTLCVTENGVGFCEGDLKIANIEFDTSQYQNKPLEEFLIREINSIEARNAFFDLPNDPINLKIIFSSKERIVERSGESTAGAIYDFLKDAMIIQASEPIDKDYHWAIKGESIVHELQHRIDLGSGSDPNSFPVVKRYWEGVRRTGEKPSVSAKYIEELIIIERRGYGASERWAQAKLKTAETPRWKLIYETLIEAIDILKIRRLDSLRDSLFSLRETGLKIDIEELDRLIVSITGEQFENNLAQTELTLLTPDDVKTINSEIEIIKLEPSKDVLTILDDDIFNSAFCNDLGVDLSEAYSVEIPTLASLSLETPTVSVIKQLTGFFTKITGKQTTTTTTTKYRHFIEITDTIFSELANSQNPYKDVSYYLDFNKENRLDEKAKILDRKLGSILLDSFDYTQSDVDAGLTLYAEDEYITRDIEAPLKIIKFRLDNLRSTTRYINQFSREDFEELGITTQTRFQNYKYLLIETKEDRYFIIDDNTYSLSAGLYLIPYPPDDNIDYEEIATPEDNDDLKPYYEYERAHPIIGIKNVKGKFIPLNPSETGHFIEILPSDYNELVKILPTKSAFRDKKTNLKFDLIPLPQDYGDFKAGNYLLSRKYVVHKNNDYSDKPPSSGKRELKPPSPGSKISFDKAAFRTFLEATFQAQKTKLEQEEEGSIIGDTIDEVKEAAEDLYEETTDAVVEVVNSFLDAIESLTS